MICDPEEAHVIACKPIVPYMVNDLGKTVLRMNPKPGSMMWEHGQDDAFSTLSRTNIGGAFVDFVRNLAKWRLSSRVHLGKTACLIDTLNGLDD